MLSMMLCGGGGGDTPPVPGLIAWQYELPDKVKLSGWYGVIPSSDFITARELDTLVNATNVGVSTGVDDGWLKFYIDGRILYTPKKPTRHNASGAAFDTLMNKTITIKGNRYSVKHWNITNTPSKTTYSRGEDETYRVGSDYRRLMVRLMAGADFSIAEGTDLWAKYTTADIGMNAKPTAWLRGPAGWRYVQTGTTYELIVTWLCSYTGDTINGVTPLNAWLPCLELLGPA